MERFTFRDYLIAYAVMGVLTFGHSGAKHPHQLCNGFTCQNDSFLTAAGAFMSGALWPLYWSWELQS